jgi:hypothetical protein
VLTKARAGYGAAVATKFGHFGLHSQRSVADCVFLESKSGQRSTVVDRHGDSKWARSLHGGVDRNGDGMDAQTAGVCSVEEGCVLVEGCFAREKDEHYMELVIDFSMRDQTAVETLHSFLHSILDNALGPRLELLKAALPKFHENQKKDNYPIVQPGADEDTPAESVLS